MDYLDVKRDDINYANIYNDTYILMKNAGKAVAEFINRKFPDKKEILIVCGTGNNAGDGICAASFLKNKNIKLQFIKKFTDLKTYESRRAFNESNADYYNIESLDKNLKDCDVIVDAIFGIGISGDPREPYANTINKINNSQKIIISIDVPSGFPFKIKINADYTITFTDIKENMDKDNCGDIIVKDIGIPENIKKNSGPGDLIYLKTPDSESHKGMNGTLAIIGGFEYYGSAVISALGAYNTGIDLVRVYTKSLTYSVISSYYPGIIVRDIDKINTDEILKNDSILIGPGMGLDKDYILLIKKIIDHYNGNIIMDADALKLLKPDDVYNKKCIVTPHKMEFKSFYGAEPEERNSIELSKKYKITTVLKGKTDIITDGNSVYYSSGGNARMTMGGTGDLLSGIIAGLVSRGIKPVKACVMGTYINKKAGELSYNDMGFYYSIEDMIDKIPGILNKKI